MAKITKLPKSIVEIEDELSAPLFENYRENALADLSANLELPGFRKGHIPKDVAEKAIPEIKILEKMAAFALNKLYPELLQENKIDAIGNPEITITKLAPNNPLGFKIKTAVMPEFNLPDYKAIAKKVPPLGAIIATDEEIEKTIEQIRQMRKNEAEELPTFDDAFVKTLGKFENVLDFKNRLRENIKVEKEAREQDKRRLEIVKNIVTEIKIELPEIIIESETQNMLNQMKRDIERSGLKFEEYLQNINKKEADLKKDWQQMASDRVVAEIIIRKIGEAENLKPEEKEIEENFSVLASSVQKEKVSPEVLKNYVYDSLFKEKVFSFLENLANSK